MENWRPVGSDGAPPRHTCPSCGSSRLQDMPHLNPALPPAADDAGDAIAARATGGAGDLGSLLRAMMGAAGGPGMRCVKEGEKIG